MSTSSLCGGSLPAKQTGQRTGLSRPETRLSRESMASRTWTCRSCKTRSERRKRKFPSCGKPRPVRKTAAQRALADPYDVWAERFGTVCNICGRQASDRRRLDRDHDHKTGRPRGLLCNRCNRALPSWVTAEWLRKAAAYLERAA
jgi:hypothetical protein